MAFYFCFCNYTEIHILSSESEIFLVESINKSIIDCPTIRIYVDHISTFP
jgi:hypothetical protein